MAVKYLSEDWAKEVTQALNANDAFQQQAGGKTVKLQQVVQGPDGETKYYFKLDSGTVEVAIGELADAEATLTSDYDTSAQLSRAEVNATAAYMSGKLKIQGDLMKLMQLQGLFNAMPAAVKDVDVEY
jgi:putative sterol carrier protein